MPYPDWTTLAPLVLAMSLASLRLEVFSERRQIKNHALKALQDLSKDPAQIPREIRKMKMFKQLQTFAGHQEARSLDSKSPGQTRYQRMWDRVACTWIAYISGTVVLATPFVRVGSPEERIWFLDQVWIHWFLTSAMAVALGLEIFFVLYASRVIKKSINLIDDNAEQLSLAI